jgi:hypothetical protein
MSRLRAALLLLLLLPVAAGPKPRSPAIRTKVSAHSGWFN